MKIVIDIPKEIYEEYVFVQLARGHGKGIVSNLFTAIKKGTPLPEHYGDLIDRDAVLDDIVKKNPEWVSETGKRKRYARLVYYWAVKNAPTIIKGCDEI